MLVFLVIIASFLFVPSASATVLYNATVSGTDVLVDATIELYTSEPGNKVNYWQTELSLPEKSKIISLADSQGVINDYTYANSLLMITTNKGAAREKEVLDLVFRIPSVVTTEFPPLSSMKLNFSGFADVNPEKPDEQTFVEIRTPIRLVFADASYGFVTQSTEKIAQFSGSGAVGVTVWFGSGGTEYEHYLVFGNGDAAAADADFSLLETTLGIRLPGVKYPVIALSEENYNRKVNPWSVGQYRNGILFIRENQSTTPTGTATLLHETVHAVNGRLLRFVPGGVAWFDEGVAQYVEFLEKQKLGVHQAQLFGEKVTWAAGNLVYTLAPRGKPNELWSYYQLNEDIMNKWTPETPATRTFGYALSELVIRESVLRNGPMILTNLYTSLPEGEMSSAVATTYLLSKLNTDLRPCDADTIDAMKSCLAAVNAMAAPLPGDTPETIDSGSIVLPDITPPEIDLSFLETLVEWFRQAGDWLRGLFEIA